MRYCCRPRAGSRFHCCPAYCRWIARCCENSRRRIDHYRQRGRLAGRPPIISAVGHEIDVSISDLVADRRALTPTEAAEFAVPDQVDVRGILQDSQLRLQNSLKAASQQARFAWEAIANRRIFQRPMELLNEPRRILDEQEQLLSRQINFCYNRSTEQLRTLAAQLDALSPLKVLARGYSTTTDFETGKLIKTTKQCTAGQKIKTKIHDGELISEIVEVSHNE